MRDSGRTIPSVTWLETYRPLRPQLKLLCWRTTDYWRQRAARARISSVRRPPSSISTSGCSSIGLKTQKTCGAHALDCLALRIPSCTVQESTRSTDTISAGVWAGARRWRNAPKPCAGRLGCGRRRAVHRPGSTDGSRPNRPYTGNGLCGLGPWARNPGWRAAHAEAFLGKP